MNYQGLQEIFLVPTNTSIVYDPRNNIFCAFGVHDLHLPGKQCHIFSFHYEPYDYIQTTSDVKKTDIL